MKPIFFLFPAVLLLASCSNPAAEESAATGEWQSLFNGKDINGWEIMGMAEAEVRDGALHIHATHPNNNAWVYTTDTYQDFKLECEFNMPDTTANSGVVIRFDPKAQGAPNQVAYEANIDWRTDIKNPMGTLENASRANLLADPTPESWNTMRIEAAGDHLRVFINDKKVCESHNRRATSGHIGLQVPIHQGDDIAFRNIRIQELPEVTVSKPLLEEQYRNSDRPMVPMLNDASLEGWSAIGPGRWTFEEDGSLHGYSGEIPSFLVTDQAYRSFYLKTDFKIAKEDNSGIFIRKNPDSTAVSTDYAIECNIYDHDGPAHAYSTGSIALHARAWHDLIDYDDWNEMEIFARGDHVVLYVNDTKSSEAHLPAHFDKAGNICLQAGTKIFTDNGPSDVYFRNMMIRVMD